MEKFRGRNICLGLDVNLDLIPPCLKNGKEENSINKFLTEVIAAIKDISGLVVKPNYGYYSKYGSMGIACLEKLMNETLYGTGIASILDGKFNDVKESSRAYAAAAYRRFNSAAVTINPYEGEDALLPLMEVDKRLTFVLCKTSNKDSGELQDLPIPISKNRDGKFYYELVVARNLSTVPLYLYVACRVKYYWNKKNNLGLVVEANHLAELRNVRDLMGSGIRILSPALGAQSDSKRESFRNPVMICGEDILINLGQSTLYKSSGSDFADAVRKDVLEKRSWVFEDLEERNERTKKEGQ